MHLFQTRNSRTTRSTTAAPRRRGLFHRRDNDRNSRTTRSTAAPRRRGFFHRKDNDRVAGGLKASLTNPNTTRAGRRQAKRELRGMGRERETHVPLMVKIKRALGIRSTPRRARAMERTQY